MGLTDVFMPIWKNIYHILSHSDHESGVKCVYLSVLTGIVAILT